MTTEQEIIGLERSYWQAIKERDFEAALALTNDPCIVTGAQGAARLDEKTFRSMMGDSTWTLEDFELNDFAVELYDDTAVVAYQVREEMTVGGNRLTLEAADASTWVRNGDRWRCALHTESVLGDPFGRDRAVFDGAAGE